MVKSKQERINMEKNSKVFDLTGLKLVLTGLIVSFIAEILGSGVIGFRGSESAAIQLPVTLTAEQVTMGGYIITAVRFAMTVLIIIGLAMASKNSGHLKKAYIALIVSLVYIVAFAAGIYYLVQRTGSAEGLMGKKYLIAIGVALLVGIIISIVYTRQLIMGCADIAGTNGDTELVRKCRGTWMLYLLAMILLILGLGIMFGAGASFFVEVMNNLKDLSKVNLDLIPAVGFMTGGFLLALAAILNFFAQIRIIFRVGGACKYHGKDLPLGFKAAA